MAKVFGIHTIQLKPGVKPEDFEKFLKGLPRAVMFEGWKVHMLKGLRGDRQDRFLWMWEIESIEALNRYFPSANPADWTEEANKLLAAGAAEYEQMMEKWDGFATRPNIVFTDYVVVE